MWWVRTGGHTFGPGTAYAYAYGRISRLYLQPRVLRRLHSVHTWRMAIAACAKPPATSPRRIRQLDLRHHERGRIPVVAFHINRHVVSQCGCAYQLQPAAWAAGSFCCHVGCAPWPRITAAVYRRTAAAGRAPPQRSDGPSSRDERRRARGGRSRRCDRPLHPAHAGWGLVWQVSLHVIPAAGTRPLSTSTSVRSVQQRAILAVSEASKRCIRAAGCMTPAPVYMHEG
eukprot:357274-Chlamydomonas_euryale.AAC.19